LHVYKISLHATKNNYYIVGSLLSLWYIAPLEVY
jgi:hypothetical protein